MKENNQKKFDLQERFIDYAVRIIHVSEQLPETKTGKHISSQILRSGTSPAANYGEAQSAESKADFIHKLKVALKELRETEVWLKIYSFETKISECFDFIESSECWVQS